jgi:hypothetical protein
LPVPTTSRDGVDGGNRPAQRAAHQGRGEIMAKIYYEKDADLSVLNGKTIAITPTR